MSAKIKAFAASATGVTADSREIKKGYVFVAVKGEHADGHDFIKQAIASGAKYVVGEKPLNLSRGVAYLKVSDSKEALGILASQFYGRPSSKLKTIGITGTKGKTTTAHMIYHILVGCGKKAGLVSSVTAKIGSRESDTGFHVTTPDAPSLQKFLSQMVEARCGYAVIEVSSHAILQRRIAGIDFDLAVLTNIAPEHLDYHKTFSEYKKTKLDFLNSAKEKIIAPKITRLNIFPGEFNNLNAQTAINAVKLLGISEKEAIRALHSFKLPPGRMEEIKTDKNFRVFIDFAHTPDSLEAALTYLKSITKNRLISVFGAAGERDPRKREKMGEISSRLSDLSIFTAEDPRSEDLFAILDSMRQKAKNFKVIPERGEAIAEALSLAGTDDVISFFGKGHEKSMAFEGFEHPWNEREMIQAQLSNDYKDTAVIVLAAGEGTRMKSQTPKVLHKICGRPMLAYTLENLRKIGMKDISVVVSYKKELVIKAFAGGAKFAVQKIAKGGTADATKAGLTKIDPGAKEILVINGDDSAFYLPETLKKVIASHKESKATLSFVSLIKSEPKGLGRVARDASGKLLGIIEEKDATESQRKIKEVNDGVYLFDGNWLRKNISNVPQSPVTGEYYLVEMVRMAMEAGEKVSIYKLPNDSEWQGINTPEELARAEEKMKKRLENYAA